VSAAGDLQALDHVDPTAVVLSTHVNQVFAKSGKPAVKDIICTDHVLAAQTPVPVT
jgi:hypothetical protein